MSRALLSNCLRRRPATTFHMAITTVIGNNNLSQNRQNSFTLDFALKT